MACLAAFGFVIRYLLGCADFDVTKKKLRGGAPLGDYRKLGFSDKILCPICESLMDYPQREQRSLTADTPTFPGEVMSRVVLHWVILIGLTFVVGVAIEYLLAPTSNLADQLNNFWRRTGPFMLLASLVMVVSAFDVLRFATKHAGPIQRLDDAMNRLATGEVAEELQFREDDEWSELAEKYNRIRQRVMCCGDLEEPQADEEDECASPDRPIFKLDWSNSTNPLS